MPSYTSAQRAAIQQFAAFTQAKESIAGKFLKSNDWNVDRAVNAFFNGGENTSATQSNMKKLFDTYRDNVAGEPDKIGIDGAQRYLTDLNIALDEVAHFALCELLKCPSIGEFSREDFTNGWRVASTPANACDTITKQTQYIDQIVRPRLSADLSFAKQVYRYAFKLAKTEQQRSIPMDSAVEFWRLFFTTEKGGIQWNSSTTPWLDMWIEFYEKDVKRPVNKDLWNMVGELMMKTKEPNGESLEWWTEDGAWPVAVDQFVALVKERRGSGMDTT